MKKINGVLHNVNEEDIKLLNENPTEFWKDVTSISKHAFEDCKSLTEIKIPDSVTDVGYGAFMGIQRVHVKGICLHGDLVYSDMLTMVEKNPNLNFNQMNSLCQFLEEQNIQNVNSETIRALIKLSGNLGMLESNTTVVETGKDKEGKPIMSPVNNIVCTFLQGVIKNNQLELKQLPYNLEQMRVYGYNEAFMKFVTDKSNWPDNVTKYDFDGYPYEPEGICLKNQQHKLNDVHNWFRKRAELDLTKTNSVNLPVEEENRFNVMVYETSADGAKNMYWEKPTMYSLLKEFDRERINSSASLDRECTK